MTGAISRPASLALLLSAWTFIPVMNAAVSLLLLLMGALPEESLRFSAAPSSFFLHALSGVLFGVLGPLQFVRAVRSRFGRLHRIAGRVFVLSGAGLALSGASLLLQIESISTRILELTRGILGLALLVALTLGVVAARNREFHRHRAWMIRSYAIGLGTAPAALALFPVYVITGEPPTGVVADTVVASMWMLNIALGERFARSIAVGGRFTPSSDS